MNDGREGESCIWFSRPPNGTKLYTEQPASVAAALTDEQILEAMRLSIYAADGGYVFDTAKDHVVAAGRALMACLDKVTRLNSK